MASTDSASAPAQTRTRPHIRELIAQREFGIQTYGMTPPKAELEAAKVPVLAATHTERLRALNVDGIVVYDIHDEAQRTPTSPRPFPFQATFDGLDWARNHLGKIDIPFVHFRCITKYTRKEFESHLTSLAASQDVAVIVGADAAGRVTEVNMGLAYELRKNLTPELPIGAVAIPERHAAKGDEHLRMWRKQTEGGVSIFITQCVYNLEEAKNMLSVYHRHCVTTGTPVNPVLITLTPCGSVKTLDFLSWLGVKVSPWLQNDLLSTDREGGILEESVEALLALFRDLAAFAAKKGIPLGVNVESVAVRKVEIEASLRMVAETRKILDETREKYWKGPAAVAAPAAGAPAAAAATA